MIRYAESRGLTTPRTFTAALDNFRDSADTWFDGTVEAVDQRLARVNKLLHVAHTKAAEDPASQLGVIAELSTDRTALKALREDLLTAAAGRKTSRHAVRQVRLSAQERRWVTLESARFFAEQEDARHDPDEMIERGRRYAEVAASTQPRTAVLVDAFGHSLAELARRTPRPRTAARKPVFTAFPDSLLFL